VIRRTARAAPWLASVLLAALAAQSPAAAERYRLDEARSEVVVLVFRAGVASALAHDHVVRATRLAGTLEVEREVGALTAEVTVDARSLAVDEPEQRAKHGLAGALSAADRGEVRQTMLGPSQLDVDRHPELRFGAAQLDRADGGLRLAGDLGIRGTTRRVSLPLRVEERGDELHASGTLRFRQSAFGIEPYSAMLGAVRNRDEVELRFAVVAVPAVPADAAR
jgi:polyisoprenoid-binding protein YceI